MEDVKENIKIIKNNLKKSYYILWRMRHNEFG